MEFGVIIYYQLKEKNMESKKPTAELISWTNNSIETVYVLWQSSKMKNFNMSVEDVKKKMKSDAKFYTEIYLLFNKVLRLEIPIAENIYFTFVLKDIPISLREQMVRHRIGVQFGENFGVDIIPDLAKSSWWSQSMRIKSFENLYSDKMYFVPETIMQNKYALDSYNLFMQMCEEYYNDLVTFGVPLEDARNILPLASNMDISWTLNLSAFMKIIGKRSCWILQYSLWSYLIKDMIKELAEKVDPIFDDLILPPCFSNGKFHECKFKIDNERRKDGESVLPVCPLYFQNHMDSEQQTDYEEGEESYKRMIELAPKYEELWKRDAYTGEKINE